MNCNTFDSIVLLSDLNKSIMTLRRLLLQLELQNLEMEELSNSKELVFSPFADAHGYTTPGMTSY